MLQSVQSAYKSFEDSTSRINSLALPKSWKIEVKEYLAVASLMSSDYVLLVYEIFVDNLINFTVRVHSWVLPDNHELIQSYDASFNNFTLSKLIERLSSYKLYSGITLPDTRKEINFIKHVLLKVFHYIDYKTADLKELVFQDEYFITRNCSLLFLSTENTCKICEKENIKFKTEVNSKKASLAKPAHLNAPVKFTSPKRIKLTLQQKRLQCKQLEQQISAMKKALDNEGQRISPERSNDFHKLFSESDDLKFPPFMKLF